MRYVFDTTRTIAQYLRRDQLVVLESTTYPGTTDHDVRAILEESGLIAGRDFHESPSYRLMEKLEELGAEDSFNDPCIPVIRKDKNPLFFKAQEWSGEC